MAIIGVKGTHDVIKKEANQYSFVEAVMKNIAEIFAYQEIRLPIIEHSELFVRGVGEGSDVVRKEMYTFLDKGGRLITLRPEFTAGIIRSFVENKLYADMDYPQKFYYCGPVFRYERPQLGRYRQFNQFGVEAIGSNSPHVDVDVISLAITILASLGLESVSIKINSIGDEVSRTNYKKALKAYFAKYLDSMCEDCKSRYELNPLRILDCKDPNDQKIIKGAPNIKDYLTKESKERYQKVLEELDALDIPYEEDDTLVRGLDYYSEVVFEFHFVSKKGNDYGAIGAGGHYANLVKEIGGPDLPGVGFSFGIERIVSVLNDNELLSNEESGLAAYLIPLDESCLNNIQKLCLDLRLGGYVSEMAYEISKVGSMIKKANKKGAKMVVIMGPEEKEKGIVQVKDLATGIQKEVVSSELVDYFDNLGEPHEHECGCHHHEDTHECDCECDCGHMPGEFPCKETGVCPCGNDYTKCNCHITGKCSCLTGEPCECGCHHDEKHEHECGCHHHEHNHECCHHTHEHTKGCGCGCGEHECDCGHMPGEFPCKETGVCPCGNDYKKCTCHVNGTCNCLKEGKK